jgi:hypothetical protein
METTQPVLVPAPELNLPRVSWGAIFAGAFVSLAAWFVLYMLGLGIGLTTIDPDAQSSLQGILLGTTVWSLIAPIIGLFVGGLVVGRMVGPLSRPTGAVYGVIVWSVSAVAAVFVIWSTVSAIAGTATRAASAVGDMGSQVAGNLHVTTSDLVVPVNQRLQAMGKPAIDPSNLEQALQRATRQAIMTGSFDREALIDAIAQETALTRQDAEQVSVQLEQRITGAGNTLKHGALQALDTTGKGIIWLMISLLVSLIGCIGGATLIVGHEQKRADRLTHATAAR